MNKKNPNSDLSVKSEGVASGNREMDICPTCGGKLLERDGKFGKFFGCSNFPKCRFTKKNED